MARSIQSSSAWRIRISCADGQSRRAAGPGPFTSLTEAGAAALQHWLESDEEAVYELRDEGMLKLFFSDSAPEGRIEIVRAMRTREERALAHLRSIEPHASTGPLGSYLTLQLGIGLTQWTIDWCKATERQLAG